MPSPTILVVDDEALIRWSLVERLRAEGYQVLEAETGNDALDRLHDGVDLVLLDYKLPDIDGVTVLRRIKEFDQDILVILLTAYASVETAVEAMKIGAYHFANKPFKLDEIVATVAARRSRRRSFGASCVSCVRTKRGPTAWIESSASRKRCGAFGRWSRNRAEPRVDGAADGRERDRQGSRRQGHSLRQRSRRSAIHEHHVLGAARKRCSRASCSGTSAARSPTRAFRSGDSSNRPTAARCSSTKSREMVPALQAKLLRFLEEKAFKRVGGSADIRVDVRVIAATNRVLDDEVRQGRFRSDLYYRLNVLPIALPPLRAHSEDIPALVDFFMDSFNREFRKNFLGASPAAVRLLQSYGWPGNVRELRNVIERAMLLAEGERLEPRDFAALASTTAADVLELPAGGVDLEALERSFVVQALKRSGGNQTKAAALLGLNRDQIRYRIEKFGLSATAQHHE